MERPARRLFLQRGLLLEECIFQESPCYNEHLLVACSSDSIHSQINLPVLGYHTSDYEQLIIDDCMLHLNVVVFSSGSAARAKVCLFWLQTVQQKQCVNIGLSAFNEFRLKMSRGESFCVACADHAVAHFKDFLSCRLWEGVFICQTRTGYTTETVKFLNFMSI